MFANLSVEETLTYSAMLRLPASMSREEKLKRVESTISDLGLQGCRKTWIGGDSARGVSGGERKRVSIGIELVTNPQLLFLDEVFIAFSCVNSSLANQRLGCVQCPQLDSIAQGTSHQAEKDHPHDHSPASNRYSRPV